MRKYQYATGFTLIELLTAVGIIIMLITVGGVGYLKYINTAQKSREIHAGRVLISGVHAYAADNGGRIIKAMDNNPRGVVDDKGRAVMVHAAKRWPWRLAPYIDYNVNMVMVNNQKAAPTNSPMYSYLVTVFPTFGMNGTFVGGKYGTVMAPDHPRNNKGTFCVTSVTHPILPSKLIVFSSAKMQGAAHTGCFDVSAPGVGAVGEVDYKYENKAVVVYFDGHMELNSPDQLKDMRRWSNLAAIADDPNWSW